MYTTQEQLAVIYGPKRTRPQGCEPVTVADAAPQGGEVAGWEWGYLSQDGAFHRVGWTCGHEGGKDHAVWKAAFCVPDGQPAIRFRPSGK